MRGNEITTTILVGKISRTQRALAGKEETLNWVPVPRSNHELDGRQQQLVNVVPTAVYSNLGLGQTSNPSSVEYIKNKCDKESTSFQRGSKRRTFVDPISQVPLL